MALQLSIVTPERPLVETEVESVVVPGANGEFGVLPGHEPFLAPLQPGVLYYKAGGQQQRVAISGGFAEVARDRVTVLARSAELVGEIDRSRAERALSGAEEALRATDVAEREQIAMLGADAARASARLKALGG